MKLFKYIFFIAWLLLSASQTFALTEKEASRLLGVHPPHKLTFLNIKAYQQTTDYTCGSALVLSLMHYYGMISEKQMNKSNEMRIAREMGTTQKEGTDEFQIANWLKKNGFKVYQGKDGSISLIRHYLAKGVPVLVDWIDWGGHWVIVAGYDFAGNYKNRDKDTIFFADSAAHFANVPTQDGIICFNADRFASMWFNSKHVRNIYIVAVPKHLSCLLKNN